MAAHPQPGSAKTDGEFIGGGGAGCSCAPAGRRVMILPVASHLAGSRLNSRSSLHGLANETGARRRIAMPSEGLPVGGGRTSHEGLPFCLHHQLPRWLVLTLAGSCRCTQMPVRLAGRSSSR